LLLFRRRRSVGANFGGKDYFLPLGTEIQISTLQKAVYYKVGQSMNFEILSNYYILSNFALLLTILVVYFLLLFLGIESELIYKLFLEFCNLLLLVQTTFCTVAICCLLLFILWMLTLTITYKTFHLNSRRKFYQQRRHG